jgi:AAA+ ATPase superfamily predicted ATPase
MFINRESEIGFLEAIHRRPGAQFVAVYGRRRIGKTALLCHWLERFRRQKGAYWVAYRSSPKILLERFSEALRPWVEGVEPGIIFPSWEAAFRQLGRLAARKRWVAILDEFPYLVESVPGIASILQAVWDRDLKTSRLMLVVSGSQYRMMHDELLSGRGPLFGRTTADLLLDGIAPREMSLFLPRYSNEQVVETYSVIGGVPKYLELWDDERPVLDNIKDLIFSPVSIFRQEPQFLIQDEISDARTYLAILESVGMGLKGPAAVAESVGIALPHVGKYLQTLRMLRLIRREVSLDAVDPLSTRLGRYELADPLLRFFFTFVRPNSSSLEQGRIERIMELIRERFESYVAHTGYEEMCRQVVARLGDAGKLPFRPELVGRIWNRRLEVDVAAIHRKERCVLLGECKWTRRKTGMEELQKLEAKAGGLTRIRQYKVHLMFFARGGFTAEALAWARREKALLFEGLERIV